MNESFIYRQDTIAAISTGNAPGAIGILRLSGPGVLCLLDKHCLDSQKQSFQFETRPREAIYCNLIDAKSQIVDDIVAIFYKNPYSYTGEDLAELNLHGNPILLRRALQMFTEAKDCRPAEPGEFTLRAYRNNRMDLIQAEAVHRIISARSDMELEAGRKNLYGELSRQLSLFRSAIIHLKAETAAEVDFSEEDLTFASKAARVDQINGILSSIDQLLERGARTEKLRHGFQVALVGVPNAGKSSLLNAILGWDRAIVAPLAGTTRDYISEEILLDGISVRFVDTAGLRKTVDHIEAQGMQFAKQIMQQSHLVLHLIDGAQDPYDLPDLNIDSKIVYILNKIDLSDHREFYLEQLGDVNLISLSCKTRDGLNNLHELLKMEIFKGQREQDPLLLEDRHRYHFIEIKKSLFNVLQLWDEGAPDEIVAMEIDRALDGTGQITGRIDTEEVLGRIFSVFCVGK